MNPLRTAFSPPRLAVLALMGIIPIVSSAAPGKAKLPEDARRMLETFPGKTVSLDLVVSRALAASDQFKAVAAQKISIPVARLQSRAPLDYTLEFSGSYLDDQNETASAVQPQTFSRGLSLGLSTYFRTGTAVSAGLEHSLTELDFPGSGPGAIPDQRFLGSVASLSITQNLWKDAFGYATRRAVRAGEIASEATEAGFKAAVEDWVLDLIDLFYNAWLAQARAEAAEARVERQQRLQNVTSVKAKRGTAERDIVIQVRGALVNARVSAGEAKQGLERIWRELVTSLKLPEAWLDIDPMLIPITLDEPVDETLKACGPKSALRPPPEASNRTLQAQKQAEAARLQSEAARNRANPQLAATVGLEANSLDEDKIGITLAEAVRAENPAWQAALSLRIPLGASAEEADVRASRAEFERADALAAAASSRLKVEWINTCLNLHRLNEDVKTLRTNYQEQFERAELLERWFRIGRSTAFDTINASAEATAAELALRDAQISVRRTAWEVRRLTRRIETYLERLMADPPRIEGETEEASS